MSANDMPACIITTIVRGILINCSLQIHYHWRHRVESIGANIQSLVYMYVYIHSYTHFYCIYVNFSDQILYMSDFQQSQFEKLKSYVISGRSEQSEDIQ